MMRGLVVFSLLSLALAGCTALPASAPTAREVEQPAESAPVGFVILDINDDVRRVLGTVPRESFHGSFQSRRPAADVRIGPGDVLQISIWEAGGSGLFGPAGAPDRLPAGSNTGARAAPLQPVMVGRDGMITIPFAGRIQAAGRTADQLRAQIEFLLRDKAIQPQAMVIIQSNTSNVVTVGGEVNRAGVIPLSLRGERLLDAISNAGGAKHPAYETSVRVTRGHRSVTVSLMRILESPDENIYVQPGDLVYVSRSARSFTAFGATGKVGHYPFDTERLSLAEAVAKAGGLIDNQSDPAGVFLFRYEASRTVTSLRPDLKYERPVEVPVVYRLNLREANGYFHARNFGMRDKDVILIANADGTQLLKFFNLLRGATGVVGGLRSATY